MLQTKTLFFFFSAKYIKEVELKVVAFRQAPVVHALQWLETDSTTHYLGCSCYSQLEWLLSSASFTVHTVFPRVKKKKKIQRAWMSSPPGLWLKRCEGSFQSINSIISLSSLWPICCGIYQSNSSPEGWTASPNQTCQRDIKTRLSNCRSHQCCFFVK